MLFGGDSIVVVFFIVSSVVQIYSGVSFFVVCKINNIYIFWGHMGFIVGIWSVVNDIV